MKSMQRVRVSATTKDARRTKNNARECARRMYCILYLSPGRRSQRGKYNPLKTYHLLYRTPCVFCLFFLLRKTSPTTPARNSPPPHTRTTAIALQKRPASVSWKCQQRDARVCLEQLLSLAWRRPTPPKKRSSPWVTRRPHLFLLLPPP